MNRQRAIIFGPVDDQERWEGACLAYCERRRYEVVGLVVGEEKWADAWAAMTAGHADLIVVASEVYLPPHRSPRVETVTGELPRISEQRSPASRRTGRVRRWGR